MFVQPFLQRKSNKYYIFWVCVCSVRYPECNAHAPYCHLWPVRLYNIFPHYLIIGTILEKKKLIEYKMCVLIFSRAFFWNISHLNKNWARYDKIKCIGIRVKYSLFLSDFNKTWIISTEFWKILQYQTSWSPSSGSRVVTCVRTERQTDIQTGRQTDKQTWRS